MKTISFDEMGFFPDPFTDERLLPAYMRGSSNDEDISRMKAAARIAIEQFLTDEQREAIHMHYWEGMNKTAIGQELGISVSAVCKRLKTAHSIIRDLTEYSLEVQKEVKSQKNTGDIL